MYTILINNDNRCYAYAYGENTITCEDCTTVIINEEIDKEILNNIQMYLYVDGEFIYNEIDEEIDIQESIEYATKDELEELQLGIVEILDILTNM